MKIQIRGPWQQQDKFADQDRQELKFLFGLEHSHGKESIALTDHREYRATCDINTDDYTIEKAPSPENA